MDADVGRLLDITEREERLLRNHNELFWANWLQEGRTLLSNGDLQGVRHILSGFGGMGSLNDLFISRLNHHLIEADSEEVNRVSQQQLSAIHALAIAICREMRRGAAD